MVATVTLMGEFDSIMVIMVLPVVIIIIICNLKVIMLFDLRLTKEEVRAEVSLPSEGALRLLHFRAKFIENDHELGAMLLFMNRYQSY